MNDAEDNQQSLLKRAWGHNGISYCPFCTRLTSPWYHDFSTIEYSSPKKKLCWYGDISSRFTHKIRIINKHHVYVKLVEKQNQGRFLWGKILECDNICQVHFCYLVTLLRAVDTYMSRAFYVVKHTITWAEWLNRALYTCLDGLHAFTDIMYGWCESKNISMWNRSIHLFLFFPPIFLGYSSSCHCKRIPFFNVFYCFGI